MEPQKTPNTKSYPKKKEQSWGITNSDFRLYYKAILINTVGW